MFTTMSCMNKNDLVNGKATSYNSDRIKTSYKKIRGREEDAFMFEPVLDLLFFTSGYLVLTVSGVVSKQTGAAIWIIGIGGGVLWWVLSRVFSELSNFVKDCSFKKKARETVPQGMHVYKMARITYIGMVVISYSDSSNTREPNAFEIRFERMHDDNTRSDVAEMSLPDKKWNFSEKFYEEEIEWLKEWEERIEADILLKARQRLAGASQASQL